MKQGDRSVVKQQKPKIYKSNIHTILISRKDHCILSGDSWAYKFIKGNISTPYENFLTEAGKEAFLRHLTDEDTGWFFVRIDGEALYLRLLELQDPESFKLQILELDLLIENHFHLMEQLSSLKKVGELYGDVYFLYNREDDSIQIFNDSRSLIDSGTYPLSGLIALLEKKCGADSALEHFEDSLRYGMESFSYRVHKNLLKDDHALPETMVRGTPVYLTDGRIGMTGFFHPISPENSSSLSGKPYLLDALTGLVSKSDIEAYIKERLEGNMQNTVIAMMDIDNFKHINDSFGHQYGDKVLRAVSDVVRSVLGNDGLAGRFGGDEFLLVFNNIHDELELRSYLSNIKNMVHSVLPDPTVQGDLMLSVSIGCANYPADADNYDDLFTLADYCMYLAKSKGKNRYIIYLPEKHGTLEEIKKKGHEGARLNERGDMPVGELLIRMLYLASYGKPLPLDDLLQEFTDAFKIPTAVILGGKNIHIMAQAGDIHALTKEMVDDFAAYLKKKPEHALLNVQSEGNVDRLLVNLEANVSEAAVQLHRLMKKHDVHSFLYYQFPDKDGETATLLFLSIGSRTTWNQQQFPFYRIFLDVLSHYSLSHG